MPRTPVYKTVGEAIADFEIGDALFCRGTNCCSRGIRVIGRSPFSHVGMLAMRNRDWVCLDALQWHGCRSRRLRQVVAACPGQWEHWKANRDCLWKNVSAEEFNFAPDKCGLVSRERAHERMWEFDGAKYGWWDLSRASLIYLPGVRLLQKVDKLCIDDAASLETPPFCSMAYGIAWDAGGMDLVPELKHSMTTPGDLSRSLFLKYSSTLVTEQLSCELKAREPR